jgi:hypothetical protein
MKTRRCKERERERERDFRKEIHLQTILQIEKTSQYYARVSQVPARRRTQRKSSSTWPTSRHRSLNQTR